MHAIKICFISLYGYPLFNAHATGRIGGAEVQLYYMARGLAADKRFEAHFLTGDFGQDSFEMHEGVAVRSFFNPARRFKYVRGIGGAYRLMRLLHALDPHICIVRAPGFESGIAGFFCVLFHKKLVYMASQHFDPERKKNYGMHFFRWMMFKFLLRSADSIFSQHESQQQQLRDYFKKDSLVRRNAYPVSYGSEADTDRKDSVLWVGRCDPWKRPELFIELARVFPAIPFVMVCPSSGDDAYYGHIAKKAAVVSNLQFIAQVPFAHMAPYFARAMIFVNTSVSEGFPNTFLQAFDARAAIASCAVDPGGILKKYRLGVCANNDVKRLQGDMRALFADRDERVKMGDRGCRYLKEYHNMKQIQAADRKLMHALVHMKKGKPIFMEFAQYGIGGGIAAAVNFTSLFLLTEKAGMYYLLSALISYPLAFFTGFIFQALITFNHRERLLRKMAWFFFHQTIGFGLFIALLYGMTDVLGVYYVVSFFISAGIVYLFNFVFSKLVVFRSRH